MKQEPNRRLRLIRRIEIIAFTFTSLICLSFAGCGGNSKKNKQEGPALSPIEKDFHIFAQQNNLPPRMLMAVAYLESHINPTPSTTVYNNELPLGPEIADSAFGIERKELGLNPDEEPDLKSQIEAYAKWLGRKAEGLKLEPNPITLEQKFNWLLLIAGEHRGNDHRNIRAVFILELIKILNEGFTWKDPKNGQILQFLPETPKIDPTSLETIGQNLLRLYVQNSDSQLADLFPQIHPNKPGEHEKPNGILINHCPFSLSACLKLQLSAEGGKNVFFGSHYLIPQDDSIYPKPIQVSMNSNPVFFMNENGEKTISNKVIITLVGKSGFLDKGVRLKANPNWMTKWQLQRLGALVQDICQTISNLPQATTNYESCMTINEGIQFKVGEDPNVYKWGDIADFDQRIFYAHIKAFRGLPGEANFVIEKQNNIFHAGEPIKLTLKFQLQARNITLQRLIRCADQSLKWHTIRDMQVKSQTSLQFSPLYWDGGPNGDGQQFFRAKVYGNISQEDKKRELLGWDTTEVFLINYDPDEISYNQEACQGIED